MATLRHVLDTLAGTAASAIYPAGPSNPGAVGVVKIYPGWPIHEQLQRDLADGISHVSVHGRDEEKNTSRYPRIWQTLSIRAPALTTTVTANRIGLAGACAAGDVLMLHVSGTAVPCPAQDGMTLPGFAALCALLLRNAGFEGTTSTGPNIHLPPGARLDSIRVGTPGTALKELKRQTKRFQISVWSPNPDSRDAISALIETDFAQRDFLVLPDGSAGRVIYQAIHSSDAPEKAGLYVAHLIYSVEYATTISETEYVITAPSVGVEPIQQFNP